jgi:hypothetical protein
LAIVALPLLALLSLSLELAGRPGDYRDAIQGYAIEFPPHWQVLPESPRTDGDLLSTVTARPSGSLEYLSECGVVSASPSDMEDPERMWENATILEQNTVQVAGFAATRTVALFDWSKRYDMYAPNLKAPPPSEAVIYLFNRDQQAWMIACAGQPSAFDSFLPTFEAVVKSFRFTR